MKLTKPLGGATSAAPLMGDDRPASRARLRVAVPVIGTIAVLLAFHLISGRTELVTTREDDAVERRGISDRPLRAVPKFPTPASPAAEPAAEETRAGAGHGASFDGDGSIVYEAPGERPRVVASPGTPGPVDVATDAQGNVHF